MGVGWRPRRGRYLENGPHKVEVTPVRVEDGRTGRVYKKLTPIVLDKVFVQPAAGNALKAAESHASDRSLSDETSLTVMGTGRTWPGGPHSYVRILEGPAPYVGLLCQQVGEGNFYDGSPMTRHFRIRADVLAVKAK